MRAASSWASSGPDSSPLPGNSGRALRSARSLARCLSPKLRICSVGGPMNTMPADSHAAAKPEFSLKKPYPGWMAWAPEACAAVNKASCRRELSAAAPGPRRTDSSARATCREFRSASEYTATEPTPKRFNVRMMRQAISPRLATRTLLNIRVPNQNLERCGVVRVAGVVELRAVGNEHDDVHARAHLDVVAGAAQSIGKGQSPVDGDRHVHEEIDVVGKIALTQPEPVVLGDGQKIAVAAGMHGSLVERIADRIGLRGAGAPQGVVPPDRIGHNFGHDIAGRRQEL